MTERSSVTTLIDLLDPAPPAAALGYLRRGLNLDSPHLEAFEDFITRERRGLGRDREAWARRAFRRARARAGARRAGLHMGAVPVESVVAWVEQFGTSRPAHVWELERLLGLDDPTPGWNGVRKITGDGRGEAARAADGWVVFVREYAVWRGWPGMRTRCCSRLSARPGRQEEVLRSSDNLSKVWRDSLLALRGADLVPVAPISTTRLQDGWLRTFIHRRDLPGPWTRAAQDDRGAVGFLPVSGDVPPQLEAFLNAVFSAPEERWLAGALHGAARDTGWPEAALFDARSFLRALREERITPRFELLASTLDPAQRIVGAPSDLEIEEELARLGQVLAASDWSGDAIPLPPVIEAALEAGLGRATIRPDATGVADRRSGDSPRTRDRGWLEARITGPARPWYMALDLRGSDRRREPEIEPWCDVMCHRVVGLKERLRDWLGWNGLVVEAKLLQPARTPRERRRWGTPALEVLVEHLPAGTPLLLVAQGPVDPAIVARLRDAGVAFSAGPPDRAWITAWVGRQEGRPRA